MRGEFRNIIRVACIYVASIIGAGFASGQEIMQFFSTYRTGGFYGIILAGILFSAIGAIVLGRVYSGRIRSYEEFVFPIFGWAAGRIIEIVVTLFMICHFCIMIAGSAGVLHDRLGIPYKYAVLVMGFLSMVLIYTNIKGIVTLSTFITPVLVAGIVLAGLCIITYGHIGVFKISGFFKELSGNWFVSSILYTSYNSILSIVVMCSLLPYLTTRRTARFGGLLGGALLAVSALVINAAIYLFYPAAYEKELPVLSILRSISSPAGSLYAAVLWLAMLVSAVTSGYCSSERAASMLKVNKRLASLILCVVAAPLSTLGFSRLIGAVYPAFGYLGLFMILVILMHGLVWWFKERCADGYGRK